MSTNFFAVLLIAGIAVFATGMAGSAITFGLMGVGAVGLILSAFGGTTKRRSQ